MAQELVIRQATVADAAVAGPICYEAFRAINEKHGFLPDEESPQTSIDLLTMLFGHPGFYCVVAESGGRIVGSNCLDERSPIHGIGPITIDPVAQDRGVGKRLMAAVMERSASQGAPGVRLVQAAFHNRSLALYTSLGFDAQEPLTVFQGPPIKLHVAGRVVRKATPGDLNACNALCERVHGHHRGGDLADAVQILGTAKVVEHKGRITGYTSELAFFGHTVAESDTDLQALIAEAESFGHPGFLLPTRSAEMFRWCLAHGLKVAQPMTLMTRGMYREPKGAYLASVLY